LENRKRPGASFQKELMSRFLAQPAYNTVYSDHAALVNDGFF